MTPVSQGAQGQAGVDAAALLSEFEKDYGRRGRLFSAPGRVNLIGEHTDYNGGFVLPMAIEQRTYVVAAPRNDRSVRVRSRDMNEAFCFDLDSPGPPQRRSWLDYVEGMAQALLEKGLTLCGADLLIESSVPRGSGLSSSAALEISVGLALIAVAGTPGIERKVLALCGQAAEHRYVGTRCGIMDQFVVAMAEPHHALWIDCRSLEATSVPLLLGTNVVLIVNSMVHHELAASEYNQRRAECEYGVRLLAERISGVRELRDVSVLAFSEHESALPDPVKARCRHVVHENARTEEAVFALRTGDLRRFGALMFASHASLRDDYQVSCEELDFLVREARAAGAIGARMTGGGFGGCTVNLVPKADLARVQETLAQAYHARFGKTPQMFVSGAAQGAREELV